MLISSNEKVLFRTTYGSKCFSTICFIVAALAVLASFVTSQIVNRDMLGVFRYFGYGYYWFFIGAVAFIFLGIITRTKGNFIITDIKVIAQKRRGCVEIPISKISAIGYGCFETISVGSSSGKIVATFVKDRSKAFEVLSEYLTTIEEKKTQKTKCSDPGTIVSDKNPEI